MKALIVGYGFTGKKLHQLLPEADVADISPCGPEVIQFDYNNPDDWHILKSYDYVIFTCELKSVEASTKIAAILDSKKVVILSTAKTFVNYIANEVITEESPLTNCPRCQSEEVFVNSADILCLALIWGYERSPEKWLKSGRIANGNKYVNFIHVDDLCRIIVLILKNNTPSGRILVSDGKPEPWQKIADKYSIKLPSRKCGKESKKLSNKKLLSLLPGDLEFKSPLINSL